MILVFNLTAKTLAQSQRLQANSIPLKIGVKMSQLGTVVKKHYMV